MNTQVGVCYNNLGNGIMVLRKLTDDDFIPRAYDWTKTSRYAITASGVLVRCDGCDKDGSFGHYSCLHEGRWVPNEVCHAVGIRDIMEAKPVSEEEARRIEWKAMKNDSPPGSRRVC